MKRYFLYNPTDQDIDARFDLDKSYRYKVKSGKKVYIDNIEFSALSRHQIYKVWKLVLGQEMIKDMPVDVPVKETSAPVKETPVKETPVIEQVISVSAKSDTPEKSSITVDFVDREEDFEGLTKAELLEKGEEYGVFLSPSYTKSEMIKVLKEELYESEGTN